MAHADIDDDRATPVVITDDTFRRLRITNTALGALHLVSGIAMVALSNGFRIGVSSYWLGGQRRIGDFA